MCRVESGKGIGNTSMNAYGCYVKYLGLKSHFNPKNTYDYVKYNGVIKASEDSFNTRRDKYFFAKLSKKSNPEDHLISCLVEDHNMWIGDIVGEKGEVFYTQWKKRQENISYTLGTVIGSLDEMEGGFKQQFVSVDGNYPTALSYYNQGYMSHEHILALNSVMKFIPKWNATITDDIIWPRIMYRLKQYRPFVNIDQEKIFSIIDKKITL